MKKAEDKRVAAPKEAKLKLACIQKESDAQIAAAAATSVAAAAAPRIPLEEEDDVIGEIPPEVQTLSIRFAGHS